MYELLTVVNSGLRTTHDLFTGPAMPTPHGRSFGGQVMGQALMSVGETIPADRRVHSLHGYFLRPGNSNEKTAFEVARLFDGGSFSTRRVQAYQNGTPIMSMIASFQTQDGGPDHQEPVDMSRFGSPDDFPNLREKYGHLQNEKRASWILQRPFDFRFVEDDIVFRVPEASPIQNVWMRTHNTLDENPLIHAAGLVFGADYMLVEPVMRAHGISWVTPGMRAASLDFSMWFHRPFRLDEWLLYSLVSPTAQGGRGLTHGKFFTADGTHVASVSQEVMLRLPESHEAAGAQL